MKLKIGWMFSAGIVASLIFSQLSWASILVEFGPREARLNGLIKYSVIGEYKSQFDEFKGRIKINKDTREIESVDLKIKTETINSSCGWCDKIVRSKQLLDAQKFPLITFKSNEILKDDNGYRVKGLLNLHGVEKELTFPFNADFVKEDNGLRLDMSGKWPIERKEFDIVWNRVLDQGGILVGNTMTVDWGISSTITNLKGD